MPFIDGDLSILGKIIRSDTVLKIYYEKIACFILFYMTKLLEILISDISHFYNYSFPKKFVYSALFYV